MHFFLFSAVSYTEGVRLQALRRFRSSFLHLTAYPGNRSLTGHRLLPPRFLQLLHRALHVHLVFKYSPVTGPPGRFQHFAMINKAAMNNLMYVCFCIVQGVSVAEVPWTGVAGSKAGACVVLFAVVKLLFSTVAVVWILPGASKSIDFPHSLINKACHGAF